MATLVTLNPAPPSSSAGRVRFHLSLNVDDLARSLAFFRLLFDRPPASEHADYAKFELDEPPLVLSLIPSRAPRAGKLNHVGFRLPDRAALVALEQRLARAGLPIEREEGVTCCHSRQTKFWLHDPDDNLWELYILEDDAESDCCAPEPHAHAAANQPTAANAEPSTAALQASAAQSVSPAAVIWAHRLGEPLGERLFVDDGAVDEVQLEGTLNAALSAAQVERLLAEVVRILKPGARLMVHQLTADVSLARLQQRLPGPAAAIESIPTAAELANWLERAGLHSLYFETLAAEPCLTADGIPCRETRLRASKPRAPLPSAASANSPLRHRVCYKGPFRSITDDHGREYPRGEWVEVDEETYQLLKAAALSEQFVL